MGGATVFGIEDLMKLHKGFVQRREGRTLGRVVKIVLGEIPQGVPLNLSREEIVFEGRTLDWFDQGPLLGLSPGDADLLVTTPLAALPYKPQPGWRAPTATQEEIEKAVEKFGFWTPKKAPLVKQVPEDRGARRIKGTNILLFEPVHQVLFRQIGVSDFGEIRAQADPGGGTVMTFVWDFDEGLGYFYGGRFTVKL